MSRIELKGFKALMGADKLFTESNSTTTEQTNFLDLPLENLTPGKFQPRNDFKPVELNELAASIKEQGIIQPLIVRKIENKYEIIAGERRWRAARIAGLLKVPVIIREVDDATALAFALIENIQRQALNPLEEAEALQRLLTEFSLTHDQVAKRVGHSRAGVTNKLRLLKLCDEAKGYLSIGKIDMGHARALLSLESLQQALVATTIINEQLTVRQTEKLISRIQRGVKEPSFDKVDEGGYSKFIGNLEQALSEKTHSKVGILLNGKARKGKITIEFNGGINELEEVLKAFWPELILDSLEV